MEDRVSRTELGFRNIRVRVLFSVVSILMRFLSRKVLIDCLGAAVLGLNTTAYSMLEFLNFAELGIVAGVRFMLYSPWHIRNYEEVNDIITLQGYVYRYISVAILILAAILMCFFPVIFGKIALPLWYAYASFAVFLLSYMLGNFVNYRTVMFEVSQQMYHLQYFTGSFGILKACVQMFVVWFFSDGYVWWLVCEVVFALAHVTMVYWVTQKSFPFLRKSVLSFKELRTRHGILFIKIRQLFFHRICNIVLRHSLPVIIYAFISLTEVAFYGNYTMIVNGVGMFPVVIFGSLAAGVGDLVAEHDRKRSLQVFYEIFAARFILTAVIVFGVWEMSRPFITLWLGSEYVMGNHTVVLILASMFVTAMRHPFDMFIHAKGMFGDIMAPVVEVSLNLGCAIAGGYLYGLDGILGGSMVGSALILFFWKPYYLFRKGFGIGVGELVVEWVKLVLPTGFVFVLTEWLLGLINFDASAGWDGFITGGIISCGIFSVLLSVILWLSDSNVRNLAARFHHR